MRKRERIKETLPFWMGVWFYFIVDWLVDVLAVPAEHHIFAIFLWVILTALGSLSMYKLLDMYDTNENEEDE